MLFGQSQKYPMKNKKSINYTEREFDPIHEWHDLAASALVTLCCAALLVLLVAGLIHQV
jgi:hypothetical protein